MIVLYDSQGNITNVFNDLYEPTKNDKYILVDDDAIFEIEKCKVKNGELVFDEELVRKGRLRNSRIILLAAFDKYKTNVIYGIEKETPEQKKHIVEWYAKLLNLDESGFEDIPERILYYM